MNLTTLISCSLHTFSFSDWQPHLDPLPVPRQHWIVVASLEPRTLAGVAHTPGVEGHILPPGVVLRTLHPGVVDRTQAEEHHRMEEGTEIQ
jgi:hypothetical protein